MKIKTKPYKQTKKEMNEYISKYNDMNFTNKLLFGESTTGDIRMKFFKRGKKK